MVVLKSDLMDCFFKFSFGLVPLFNYGKGKVRAVLNILGFHLFLSSPCPRLDSVVGCNLTNEPGTTMPITHPLSQISMWEVCDLGLR